MRCPVLAIGAALLCGCAPAYYVHQWRPETVESLTEVDGKPRARVRTNVSILGIRKPDLEAGTVAQAEVRLLVENLGYEPLTLSAGSIALTSADLQSFGYARVTPDPVPLDLFESEEYHVVFPLPEGGQPWNYDLSSVTFTWACDFDGELVRKRAVFRYFESYPEQGREWSSTRSAYP